LLIPIFGPWIALPDADGADGKTVCAVLGLAQAAGVIMTVVGIVRFVQSGAPQPSASSGLMIGMAPTRGGAMASAGATF
jgi:hypothetical protein